MSAAIVSFAEARHARGLQPTRLAIRMGDTVRRRGSLAEGLVICFRGSGAPDSPIDALVQFSCAREFVPVAFLEYGPFDPKGAA